jgi:hypothetical protein
LLSQLISSRDWNPEHARIFGRYARYHAWGIARGSELDEAKRALILAGTGLATVALGAVGFVLVRRVVLRAILLCAVTFVLVSLPLTGLLFRYWLPALVYAAVAGACALASVASPWRWRRWPALAIASGALLQLLRQSPEDIPKNLRIAAGLSTFEREHPNDGRFAMWRFINANTQESARILAAAFYTSTAASSFGGFWVDRAFYTTDAHLQAFIRFDDWTTFLRSVQSAQITHVLVYSRQYNAGRLNFSFPAAENEFPFSRRLVDEYGRLLAQYGDLQFYEVAPERALADAVAAGR